MKTIAMLFVMFIAFHGCGGSSSVDATTPYNNGITPDDNGTEYYLHSDITVTLFWVGEEANDENDYIPNDESAWDVDWEEHYGGLDDPSNRDGYYPAEFTPKENPFYFALPYTDFEFDEDGTRKSNVYEVIPWANERTYGPDESMCKNRWIRIIKNDKVAYAQWEDAGPFEYDDTAYVFGTQPPKNTENNNAGLDVSPAVWDYLGLSDFDTVSWQFVDESEVPDGPWKAIVTTSQINWE
jgi:hypothetical protein